MLRRVQRIIRRKIQNVLIKHGKFSSFGVFELEKAAPRKLQILPSIPLNSMAILIQGPILESGNFTYQVCLFYRTLYPECQIVLSTWNYYSISQLAKFKQIGIDVVTSTDPENPGPCNVNRQIVSTIAGLKTIVDKDFVLKTRTDVILRSPVFLESLFCMLTEQEKLKRNKRIVVTSFNTFWKRPFSFNDQLQFGRISEINAFWQTPCDSRKSDEFTSSTMRDALNWSRAEVCEVYLVRNYLERLGIILPMTIEGSLEAIRDFFIVIDEALLGMYWSKMELRDLFELYRYQDIEPGTRIEQSDWMRLQQS